MDKPELLEDERSDTIREKFAERWIDACWVIREHFEKIRQAQLKRKERISSHSHIFKN